MFNFSCDSVGQIADADADAATVSVVAVNVSSVAVVSAVTVSVSTDAPTERFRTHLGDWVHCLALHLILKTK